MYLYYDFHQVNLTKQTVFKDSDNYEMYTY